MSLPESGFDFAFLVGIFTTSLVGSAHCIGMCGGLVLASTQAPSGSNREVILNQISYHGARLVSYLVLGALAGIIGKTILDQQITFYLSVLATVAVALMFISTGVQLARGEKLSGPFDKYLAQLSLKIFPKVRTLKGFARPLMTGLATGILPCGWLYSFVMMSLATKSPLKGALVLAVFWSGTVPALSFGAIFIQKILLTLNVRVYRLVGLMLVALGLWTLYGRVVH